MKEPRKMLDAMPGAIGTGTLALLVLASCRLGSAQAPPPEGGEGWSRDPVPLVWNSTYTKTPMQIDGELEKVWETARPLTIIVREAMGGDHPKLVTRRALHTNDARRRECRTESYWVEALRGGREFETVMETRSLYGD